MTTDELLKTRGLTLPEMSSRSPADVVEALVCRIAEVDEAIFNGNPEDTQELDNLRHEDIAALKVAFYMLPPGEPTEAGSRLTKEVLAPHVAHERADDARESALAIAAERIAALSVIVKNWGHSVITLSKTEFETIRHILGDEVQTLQRIVDPDSAKAEG